MNSPRFDILARSPFWAIRPEAVLFALRHLVDPLYGQRASGDAPVWECAQPSVKGKGKNKLATIPIQGVLTKDGPSYYGSNYDTITKAAEQAGADPDVKQVVLAVDSPGGEVTGLPETAAVLAALAKAKPVSAMVEGMSASAAYWLTSQANHITVTPSGEVGSVGVRMMHVDVSKMLDDMGYKITELSSGDFKTEWSPYKPLSEDAVANMQPRLESTHTDFLNAVTAGRTGRATEQARNGRFGEGRMFSAKDALSAGMIDATQAPNDFYRAISPAQEETATLPPYGLHRAWQENQRVRFTQTS